MTNPCPRPVVLLSDPETGPALAERLAPLGWPVTWYASVDELVRGQPLSSIAVLVADSKRMPKGTLLVTLGRLNIECPWIQKVALMEGPPPLPVAGYLTACGVDLVWEGSGEEKTERLNSIVEQMRERTEWVVA